MKNLIPLLETIKSYTDLLLFAAGMGMVLLGIINWGAWNVILTVFILFILNVGLVLTIKMSKEEENKSGHIGPVGALGPLGDGKEVYVIVPRECRYCKIAYRSTMRDAEAFVAENPRMKNVVIITHKEYVDVWNERFYWGKRDS